MGRSRISTIIAHLENLGFPFETAVDCPWLIEIEEKFGRKLPHPYRELVCGYRWPEFEVKGFEAFSNLGERSGYDILDAPFKDPALTEWLLPRGLIQIGRPFFANYDPVCFDTGAASQQYPIVRIDHEDILLCRKRVKVERIADSFESLVLQGQP